MVAAWRRKREARLAARRGGSEETDRVAEAWAELGIYGQDSISRLREALRALLDDLDERGEDAQVIQVAIEGPPEPSVPDAVTTALARIPPEQTIRHLHSLLQAGMPWISEIGARRVQFLAFEHPRAGEVRLPGDDVLDGTAEWRLYLAALGHPARVRPEELLEVIPEVPLPVIDDLIDFGLLGRHDRPWRLRPDAQERLYLAARLHPQSIEATEAEALGWTELERRYAFLQGDDLVGDDLYALLAAWWRGEHDIGLRSALPANKRPLFDELLFGVQTGRWPDHIVSDKGLWALLAANWRPSKPINAKISEFHSHLALFRCYRMILFGEPDKIRPQLDLLLVAARGPGPDGDHLLPEMLRAEIHNMAAYLAQGTNDLGRGIRLLKAVREAHPAVAENLRILRERQATVVNDRDHWENPYLMLGVPHGDPNWKEQWRNLRKEHNADTDRRVLINGAKARIERAELHGTSFFQLPLDPNSIVLPRNRSAALLPEIRPLDRRTSPSTPSDVRTLRDRAILSVLDDLTPAKRDGQSETQ
ncbi:hypothetical protein AB0K60_12300 [Thermopolyspora sp. NPDC052614]|uniref:hypothetical protein n=1 Tax=Thermopolyspora sp. NPDC052614 TaxID=3155682 RepID=UPI00341F81DB